ncbi:TPA: hypothetical protein RJD83_002685 [Legionella pneumophila]|nr:hypothetical protein [Legionella pneumophila]
MKRNFIIGSLVLATIWGNGFALATKNACLAHIEYYHVGGTLFLDNCLLNSKDALVIRNYLARHPKIYYVSLDNNDLRDEGVKAISQISRIEYLSLRNNKIGTDGAIALGTMPSLTYLNIEYNDVDDRGAAALAQISSLSNLSLEYNPIGSEGIAALATLKELFSLSIGGNSRLEPGSLESLTHIQSLLILTLVYKSLASDNIDVLANTSVVNLELINTQAADEVASKLSANPRLQDVAFYNTDLTDKGVAAIVMMPSLEYLRISTDEHHANYLSDEAVITIARQNSNLHQVTLGGNPIGEKGAEALSQNQSFSDLTLRNNGLTDEAACILAKNTTLRQLELSNQQIGNIGATALAQNDQIKVIDLNHNQISDEGALTFLNNTSLKFLDLTYNNIGKRGIEALKEITAFTVIFWGNPGADPRKRS